MVRGALLVLFACSVAHASAPDMFGMGARSGAMAGTGAADAEGYDAAYVNPAGLVGPTRRRLTVGYVLGRYQLRLLGAAKPVDGTDGILLGADLPLPFGGVLKDRIALGFAFYLPIGVINRAQDGFSDEPRLALLNDRTQVVSVLVAAGVRVHRRVSVGAGVLALAALVGEIAIKPDAGGHLTTVAEEQLVVNYAPVVGVRVDAAPWAQIGATFRGESASRYDIAIKSSLGAALPLSIPTLRISGTAQYDPMQLALEGAFRPRSWLTLTAGATWKHWSVYTPPVENATPGALPPPAPGYHDTAVPRLALEARIARGAFRLAGRAGYFFEWSPAPDGAGRVLIDVDRHVLTFGGGVEWRNKYTALQLDAFGQWHHLSGEDAGGDFGVFGFTVGVDL
jgi:long-chain fatty acid transport protein